MPQRFKGSRGFKASELSRNIGQLNSSKNIEDPEKFKDHEESKRRM